MSETWFLKHNQTFQNLDIPDNITILHIYTFDYSLFLTPEPNPKLYTRGTLDFFNEPNLSKFLKWTESCGMLDPAACKFNELLVPLVKNSKLEPNVSSVLIVERSKEMTTPIMSILKKKGLEFDHVIFSGQNFPDNQWQEIFIREIKDVFPILKYVKWYTWSEHLQTIINMFASNNVEWEVIKIAKMTGMLNPHFEIRAVCRMFKTCKEKQNSSFKLRKSVSQTMYLLDLPSQQLLLKKLIEWKFLPNNDPGLVLDPSKIVITFGRLGNRRMNFWHDNNKEINIGLHMIGSLPGDIYAAKFIINDENTQFAYKDKIMIVAYNKIYPNINRIGPRALESITNWKVTDEMLNLRAKVVIDSRLKVSDLSNAPQMNNNYNEHTFKSCMNESKLI